MNRLTQFFFLKLGAEDKQLLLFKNKTDRVKTIVPIYFETNLFYIFTLPTRNVIFYFSYGYMKQFLSIIY